MSLHRIFLLFSLFVFAFPAQAEIFKYYDSNGNLVLTDAPPKDKAVKAEKIETGPTMTIPAINVVKAKPGDAAKAKGKAINYAIVIHSPGNEASFQRMGDAIPVSVGVTPALLQGHRLVIKLDGVDLVDANVIKADSLDRGTHQLQASVHDEDDKVISSATSAFNIQSHSVLNPSAPKPSH